MEFRESDKEGVEAAPAKGRPRNKSGKNGKSRNRKVGDWWEMSLGQILEASKGSREVQFIDESQSLE